MNDDSRMVVHCFEKISNSYVIVAIAIELKVQRFIHNVLNLKGKQQNLWENNCGQ